MPNNQLHNTKYLWPEFNLLMRYLKDARSHTNPLTDYQQEVYEKRWESGTSLTKTKMLITMLRLNKFADIFFRQQSDINTKKLMLQIILQQEYRIETLQIQLRKHDKPKQVNTLLTNDC